MENEINIEYLKICKLLFDLKTWFGIFENWFVFWELILWFENWFVFSNWFVIWKLDLCFENWFEPKRMWFESVSDPSNFRYREEGKMASILEKLGYLSNKRVFLKFPCFDFPLYQDFSISSVVISLAPPDP